MKVLQFAAESLLVLVLSVAAGAACGSETGSDAGFDPLLRPDVTADVTASDTTATETDASACTASEKAYLDLDGDGVCGATKRCPPAGAKTCATQLAGTDCDDNDPTVFPRNYEPSASGTAAKTDKKDNDCDGHTDEDDLKITIAFDSAIANGTLVNTTSSALTTVKVKATVTISGWVDDSGTLTATLLKEASDTQTTKTFTMKNGATVVDFGDVTLSTTQIANAFTVTIAGWDDEVVAARTVIYNLAGRRVSTATIGTTKGSTVGGAMGMAMNSAMTARMFTNMSGDMRDMFNIDFTAYPAESQGVGITSKWGQPQHVMEAEDSDEWNHTWKYDDWIDGYTMYTKMSADRVSIEVIPFDGTASGLPNDAASGMTAAEKAAVSSNSMFMRFTLEGSGSTSPSRTSSARSKRVAPRSMASSRACMTTLPTTPSRTTRPKAHRSTPTRSRSRACASISPA